MKREDVNLNDVSPMMREYLNTKKDYEDSILFYHLGDFYEMFFEDAITASHALELTLTGKQAGLSERVPMCGIPHHAANFYIEKLIDLGYKVAICEQMEDPKFAKGIVKREVIRVVSKGTITDPALINEKDFNYIASISDYGYTYALSYADILIGKVYTCYIEHNSEKLISYLVSKNIKELVVASNFDKDLTLNLRNNYNIYLSINDNINYENNKIFNNISDIKLIECTKRLLCYLVDSQKSDLSHIQDVIYIDNDMFLLLDKECIRNLELVSTIRTNDRSNSLLGFLDKTKTAMGSRMLKSFIISPLTNKDEISKRHDLIDKFINEFMLTSRLRELLYEVYDLERLSGKVACNNINAKDMLQLKNSLSVMPEINDILSKLSLENIETFDELYTLLDKSIKEDASLSVKEGNIIKSGFNSDLDEIRSIRSGGKDFISSFENEERERTGIKGLKVSYNKVFGYYIEVPKGQVSLVKDEFMYDRRQTLSNCERYTTPKLKEKESLILNAEDKINNLEYEIFLSIKSEIQKYINRLQKTANLIAYYDVFSSLSIICTDNKFVRPIISDNHVLNITLGRHCVVENNIKGEYIANDIIMDEKTNILMITGPNMSGKSTYMRELGIIAVLNQIGCFVPAEKAVLPIFDKIFTRIGASDDVSSGESTFMVEMKESAYALNNATKDSLILFDELGRGTSTYDGMSLAGSIIEYICKHIKCKTLFSTHYHELTSMESKIEGIKNVHVSISEKNGEVKFLHKVLDGPIDKSYGINVAKLASLPSEVINKSLELLNEYENKNKGTKTVMMYALDLEEKKDELRDYIKTIDLFNITPIEAMNILDKIKKIA